MLYDYLLTAYKVLAGLVTTKRLMLLALAAFGVYILWICVALLFSFQRKFSSNCTKLYNYIRSNTINPESLKVIDFRIEKISNGFYYGWKKFKTSVGQKPSSFITRREALDVEVSGGVLNQGKTFMRTYIVFITGLLFIANLAHLGSDSPITCFVVAETMVLPFIFYFVMKLFYFLYTSIKQQMYKQDVQCYYELITLLDDTFGAKETVKVEVESEPAIDEEGEVVTVDGEEALEEQPEEEPKVEVNPLDDYDVFKKKNIDVEKLMNEENGISGTTLPFINVDSDYVIKDEGHENKKVITENDNGSSVLGGMMQDMSSIKKSNNFIDVDKGVAEIDNEKINEIKAQEEPKEEPKPEDPFSSFEKFEVAENAEDASQKEEPQEEPKAEVQEEPKEEKKFEEIVENPVLEKKDSDELSESEEQQIATVVSNFKSKRSKLANGGVVIERNEPIARRERPVAEPEAIVPEAPQIVDEPTFETESFYTTPEPRPVQQLDIEDSADSVLNSLKTTTGGYDSFQNFAGNAGYQNPAYGAGYQNPAYGAGYVPQMNQPYNQFNTVQPNGYGVYPNQPYGQSGFNQMNQTNYAEDYSDYEEETVEEIEEVKPKKKKVLSKEEEPRPRGLKKKEEKTMETTQVAKTRGRPKKAEVSETMTIKNDKEFDEVLARAEKLMRKSDEGLSQSQSKRIEKELKMLMDAMNRYKESK